jgi:CDP-6-deoxy-D-xylo-4-hexulose-3-dehydrase
MGVRVKQFESDFATYLGSKYAVMVNSGSSANLLAATVTSYIEKPTYPKNIVLVPALSWSTTYYPWIQITIHGFKLLSMDSKWVSTQIC